MSWSVAEFTWTVLKTLLVYEWAINGPQDIWSKFRWQIQVNVLENLTDELIYKGIECMADFLVLKLEETRSSNVSNNHFLYVY